MNNLNKGFSLVEIMVGLVIGMIAMLVMLEMFRTFEGQKRTTTGGADAQSNGAIALYMIERDVRMAGWGLDATTYSGCNTTYSYCDGSKACGGGLGALDMVFASALITDGGTNPDTVAIQFFANPNVDTFRIPANTTLSGTMPQPSAELNVTSVSGCAEGGLVLVQQGGNCTLMKITQIQGTALKIQHNPGADGEYNPTAAYQNANNWPAYTEGARLSCFSAAPNGPIFQRSYSVDTASRQLQRSDNTPTDSGGKPIIIVDEKMSPEIFDLQAQYGVATGAVGSQVITEWVDATGGDWTTPTVANWKRVKALRIALVARSSQYERPDAGTCKTTTDDMALKWSSWAKFDTTNYPDDWHCYRYKVFETTVPLRNILWANI